MIDSSKFMTVISDDLERQDILGDKKSKQTG
jgi:hypothetical protein